MNVWIAIRKLLASADGPTAVEYAMALSLLAAICAAATRTVGNSASDVFSGAAASMSAGSVNYKSDPDANRSQKRKPAPLQAAP